MMKAQPNTKLDSERIAALGIIADRLGLNFHDALVRAVDEFVLTRSPSMERPGTVGLLTGWPNASQPSSPIYGDPVTGEQGLREKDWKNLIRQGLAKDCFRGKDARAVSLCFQIAPFRNGDLDNLVRPAIDALRDEGYFGGNGFKKLDAMHATKVGSCLPCLDFWLGATEQVLSLNYPGLPVFEDLKGTFIPSEAKIEKAKWLKEVAVFQERRGFTWAQDSGFIFIEIVVNSNNSLKGIMKPVIDGLIPLLGRDPSRSQTEGFHPNDGRIGWLRVSRDLTQDEPLRVIGGRF